MQPFRQRQKRINGDRKTNSTTNKIDKKVQKEWKGRVDGLSSDSIQKLYENVSRKERKFRTTPETVD
jgi:hypothetical protein